MVIALYSQHFRARRHDRDTNCADPWETESRNFVFGRYQIFEDFFPISKLSSQYSIFEISLILVFFS